MRIAHHASRCLGIGLAVLSLLALSAQLLAWDELQEMEPYRVWMEGLDIKRSTLSPEASSLLWVIQENGIRKYTTTAVSESFTYLSNRTGVEFSVYLESWQTNRYRRISNTVRYRVGVACNGLIITSEDAAVAVVNQPYQYQITASGCPTRFHADNLPDGVSVDANGLIKGTPPWTGCYLITLYAENDRERATSTLRLDVVSGNNGGGLLDTHTLVLDENLVVTRTPGAGPAGGSLGWIVKRDGSLFRSLSALSDTRYQCDNHDYGAAYTVYLANAEGQRVSNIVTYNPHWPVFDLQITSGEFHPGTAGLEMTPYEINTDSPANQYSAKDLPSGLILAADHTIRGVPAEPGTFLATISVIGPLGRASKKVAFLIGQGPDDYTSLYTLTRDPNQGVTRTAGAHTGLVWVARVNGTQEVVRRSAVGEYSFRYSQGNPSAPVQIGLEAWIKGQYRPVSNIIADRPDGTPEQKPVFAMDDAYSAYQGVTIDPVSIHVAGNPSSITVHDLPPGLYYDSVAKAIVGTATNPGIFTPGITAVNPYGTTEFPMNFEIRPDTRGAIEDRFHLTVRPGYDIMRTFGRGRSLRWVVSRNGQRVYEYADTGRMHFNYNRHGKAGEFTVFLEDLVEDRFARVSNFAGYRVMGDQQGPVLASDRTYVLQTGASAEIQLQASGGSNHFAAAGLPAGLVLCDTNGLITGTPAAPGVTEALVTVTGSDGASSTPVVFHVEDPPSMAGYTGLYLVKPDRMQYMTRSPGNHTGLAWVFSRDGEVVLKRSAAGELSYTYDKNYQAGVYTCCLQAYVDGAFRQVSNLIEYPGGGAADFSGSGFRNLVEHAMGNRVGTEPHQLSPALVAFRREGEATYLTYRYPVNTEATDVRLHVDCSETMTNWTRATPVQVSVVSGDEKGEVRDAEFLLNSSSGFFRLSAEPQ